MVSADLSPYEASLQFIKVSNLVRLYQSVGWQVPDSLLWDVVECRYRLDRALSVPHPPLTDAEWDVLVRLRLTGEEKRAA